MNGTRVAEFYGWTGLLWSMSQNVKNHVLPRYGILGSHDHSGGSFNFAPTNPRKG